MVPSHSEFMKPLRCEMQIAADRIWDRLRFIVIVKTSEIAPAGVAVQFDQTRADHNSEAKPAKKADHEQWWTAFWERATIQQWTEKDRQEPGLKELNFPAIAVPNLADVNDRHIHRPENRENDRVGITGENNERQTKACPSEDRQWTIVGTRSMPALGEPSWPCMLVRK